jgi:vacuolar protein sorting-associated protein 18
VAFVHTVTLLFVRSVVFFFEKTTLVCFSAHAHTLRVLIGTLRHSHTLSRSHLTRSHTVDIAIGRTPSDSIHKVFLDPLGKHLLVSMESGENYYLHSEHMKPKPVARMKNVCVEAVAWNPAGDSYETKEILVGDSNGVIWEASFNRKSYDTGFYALFHMDKQRRSPLVGLWFTTAHTRSTRFVCLALSRTQLFQFYGGPTLREMFLVAAEHPDLFRLPGTAGASELEVFVQLHTHDSNAPDPHASLDAYTTRARATSHDHNQADAVRFAITTESGLFHGELSRQPRRAHNAEHALPVRSTALYRFPSALASSAPISLLVTEFHFLLVYPEQFVAINRLTTRVVYEERIVSKSAGRLLGIHRDPLDGTVWYAWVMCHVCRV